MKTQLDIQKATRLLEEGHTCVIVRDEFTLISDKTGISPMLDFLQSDEMLQGASAADKIVGKAAAMLFALAGIREVYAEVLSESGKAFLESAGIPVRWKQLTPVIINRAGTGMCPMEETVRMLEDPAAAYQALLKTRARLQGVTSMQSGSSEALP